MPQLTSSAKIFILCQLVAAVMVLTFAWAEGPSSGMSTFLVILALSAATGAMKIVLPKVQGNLSMSYVFSIWGIVNMSLGETLLTGFASTLAQSYWHAKKKPSALQLLFNLSTVSVSIGVGRMVFNAGFLRNLHPTVFRIFAVALAYFVVNTVSVSTVIGLTERISIWNVWRASYRWSFPHYLLSGSLVAAVQYLRKIIGIDVALLVLPVAYLIYQSLVLYMAKLNAALERVEQEKKHSEETAGLHLRTIRALALAIEAKDQTTGEHLHRVQTYAMELAKEFKLPPEEMQALQAAAILHDIGKIAVPESIISKPGKLTPDEFAKMKLHTIVGAEIATSVNFPFAVAPLIRSHHEKWDGSGYPDGLRGEDIPMGARILTAVDCLDALASDRQYRKAMPLEKAMSIVFAESGKAFDPRVVEVLGRRCYELERLAKSTLQPDFARFSTNEKVERGAAPDAGYAAGSHLGLDCELPADEIARELAILNSINRKIGQSDSMISDILAIEGHLRELIPFDALALYRLHGEKVENLFARGEAASLLSGLSIELGVGVSGWTVANRVPLMNGNAVTEFGVVGEVNPEFTLVSGLSIPLECEFGPIGVLTLYSHKYEAFKHSHLRALLAVGSRLAYQMRLDSSGLARPGGVRVHPHDAFGNELSQLRHVIQSDSAGLSDSATREKIPELAIDK